jgi:predicted transcriptional regulator of viral defense system
MANPGALYDWIEALPGDGRYTFTRKDARSVTEASPEAIEATLRRLRKAGRLVVPRRGFYVLVPAEYRSAGCPPATWFLDDLMEHLGRRYYVALLTAAALHGAGHQQPMAFQVMVDVIERDLEIERVRLEFHTSRLVATAETTTMQTETGTVVVSTAENTAFDLVRFPSASGHWSNIASVLLELAEKLDPRRLAAGAERVERSAVQRLGWLLASLDLHALADALAETLRGVRLAPTPLNTKRDAAGTPLDPRWQVLANETVEPEP